MEKSENLVEFEEEKISVQTPEIYLMLFVARSCVFRACPASGLLLDFTRWPPANISDWLIVSCLLDWLDFYQERASPAWEGFQFCETYVACVS